VPHILILIPKSVNGLFIFDSIDSKLRGGKPDKKGKSKTVCSKYFSEWKCDTKKEALIM